MRRLHRYRAVAYPLVTRLVCVVVGGWLGCQPIDVSGLFPASLAIPTSATVAASQSPGALGFDFDPGLIASVSPVSYAPHFLKGPYTETWSYVFSFPNGYRVVSRALITNRGPGDGRGAGIAVIIEPTGGVYRLSNSKSRERWTQTVTDDGVELRVGTHRWDIRPPVHRVSMRSSTTAIEIEAVSLTDVYRPGRLNYSTDDFYDLTILAPRLEAHGTLQVPGGPAVELTGGYGVAFHAYSNRDEQEQAVSWLQFHTFDTDLQLSLWELTAPNAHDYQRVAFSLLFEDGRVVWHDRGYQRQFDDVQADPESPHYPVPGGFTFSGQTGERAIRGEVTLRQSYRLEVVDLINSGFVRFLVRRFMEPVVYEFDGDYTLDVTLDGREYHRRGTGVASLQIVDDPPPGL